MRRLPTVIVLLIAGFILAGCGAYAVSTCPEGTDSFAEYQLFFGRSNAGGEVVSDEAWAAFLADTVTPRFPDGLTVVDGAGQWRDSAGVIHARALQGLDHPNVARRRRDAPDRRNLTRIRNALRPRVRAASRTHGLRIVLVVPASGAAVLLVLADVADNHLAAILVPGECDSNRILRVGAGTLAEVFVQLVPPALELGRVPLCELLFGYVGLMRLIRPAGAGFLQALFKARIRAGVSSTAGDDSPWRATQARRTPRPASGTDCPCPTSS